MGVRTFTKWALLAVLHRMLIAAAGIGLLPLLTSKTLAEPPDVKFLFPTGVEQGQTRTVDINGKPGDGPPSGWTSHPGVMLQPTEDGKQAELTAAADVPPGLYWGRILNNEGASELLPLIVGVLQETTESAWNDTENPAVHPLPVTISGVLSKNGEVDTYEVPLEAGQTLVASVDSNRLLASPADMVMQLVGSDGFVIAQNDDHHGIDPQIVYNTRESQSLTIRLFAFPAAPNSSIRFAGGDSYRYRLTLTTGGFVDHVLPLVVGEGMSEPLQPFGWNLAESVDSVPLTDIVSAVPLRLSRPGSFLPNRVERVSTPVLVEPRPTPGDKPPEVPVPGSISGRIDQPHQRDVYRFAGTKGQKLVVEARARHYDSPLDPVVRILDSAGSPIKEADDIAKDNADVRLAVTLPADGEYRIELTDRFGHGGLRYVYLLQTKADEPGYRLAFKKPRVTVKAGESVQIAIDVERLGGFKPAIDVAALDLPEGLTAAGARSAGEGETAKSVTLTLEAAADARFNGPVAVRGTSADQPDRLVTAGTPVVGLSVDHVWVTVVPAPPVEEPDQPSAPESGDE